MKLAIIASLLFTVSAVQAASFNCFSHEEMGPVHTMTIAESRMSSDAEGHQFKSRRVIVKEGTNVILNGEAVGTATAKKINATLLIGGDMAMGSISMKQYMPGRLTGTVTVLTGEAVKIEMSCVVK